MLELLSDEAATILAVEVDYLNHITSSIRRSFNCSMRTAIAKAIIDLAKSGQLDPTQLKRYAMAQGRTAIVR